MTSGRVLIGLFVVASLLVDLTLVAFRETLVRGPSPISTGFYLGQCAALGSWLIDGSRHRLERAAVFVLGTVGLSYLILLANRSPSYGRILAPVSLFAISVVLSSILFRISFRGALLKGDSSANDRLRFPLIEMFGWTLVVAIGSAFIRSAAFQEFLGNTEMLSEFFISAMLIGGTSACFASPQRSYFVVNWLVIVGAITYYIWAYNYSSREEMALSIIIAHLYAAAWIWVLRLAAPSAGRTGPDTDSDVQTIPFPTADPHETVQ